MLACTGLALVFMPSRIKTEVTRHFSQPLVIQTSKTSPPRVAFHETLDRPQASDIWVDLSDSKVTRINLNEMISQESPIHGLKSIRYKKVILSPMQVPREKAMEMLEQQTWVENLPRAQQARIEEANVRSRVLEQDWNLPTSRDMFREKLQEIEEQTQSENPSSVYVAAQTDAGTWVTPQDIHRQSRVVAVANETTRDGQTLGPASVAPAGKILVQGNLDLHKDIPMGPDRHLEVRWFDDGVAKETGQIDIKKGNYSILVPARSGTVVAQLLDDNGGEIGRGQFRMNDTDSLEKLRTAAISIRPTSHVASNAYPFSQPSREPGSQTMMSRSVRNPSPNILVAATGEELKADVDGQLKVEGIAEGSWTFLRTELKGYYPSIHVAAANQDNPIPLFTDKMMKALLEIARENNGIGVGGSTGSVIWGQVLTGGKGTSQIQVEIEGMPDAKPVYFFPGLLLPDTKAKATSAEGYFAFVDLPRGFHSLRLKRGNQQIGFANVEVDDGTVSPVQVAADPLSEKVPVKVFDAFTGNPEIAEAEFQHLPEAVEITGFAQLPMPHQQSLSLVAVTPKNQIYLQTIQMFSTGEDHLHLALIREDWLSSFRSARRLNVSPESGIIIGFVPGDDYEVDLPHAADFDRSQIAYFDAQGMPVENGVAGGGFIVFNAPPGSHAVTLLPKRSNVLHARLVPVDPGTVNVLKFDF